MKILKEKDLSIFKFKKCNRGISLIHVKKLMESILRKNMLSQEPIRVNRDFEVIDGQHRLEAARRLGIPIFYFVDDDAQDEDMVSLNNVKKLWRGEDYLNFYVEQGNENYIKFQDFLKKNDVSFILGLALFGVCKKELRDEFRNGEFMMKNVSGAEKRSVWIKEIVDFLVQIKGSKSFFNGISFFRSLVALTNHKNYVHDHFLKNLGKLSMRVLPQSDQKDFYAMWQEIYNHRYRGAKI